MSRGRVLAAGVALVALVGCTSEAGGPTSGPTSGASPEASRDAAADAAAELTDAVLGGDEVPEPLATVTGVLPLGTGGSQVVVDVLEVKASSTSTLLRWRLRSPGAQRVRTYTSALSLPNVFDTRAVGLVDEQGGRRLQPYTFVPQRNADDDIACACSTLPDDVGPAGLLMYALYPPLSPQTTTVDVVVPGLAVAQDIAVTRS